MRARGTLVLFIFLCAVVVGVYCLADTGWLVLEKRCRYISKPLSYLKRKGCLLSSTIVSFPFLWLKPSLRSLYRGFVRVIQKICGDVRPYGSTEQQLQEAFIPRSHECSNFVRENGPCEC